MIIYLKNGSMDNIVKISMIFWTILLLFLMILYISKELTYTVYDRNERKKLGYFTIMSQPIRVDDYF